MLVAWGRPSSDLSSDSQLSFPASLSLQNSPHSERPPVPSRSSSIRHLKPRLINSFISEESVPFDGVDAMKRTKAGPAGPGDKVASVIDALEASQNGLEDLYPPVYLAFSRVGIAYS